MTAGEREQSADEGLGEKTPGPSGADDRPQAEGGEEPADGRIAPRTPRGADDVAPATPSPRRPRVAALWGGVAAGLLVVCAAVAGAGYALGWFDGSDGLGQVATTAISQDAAVEEAEGDQADDGDADADGGVGSLEGEEEGDEEASAATDEAEDAEASSDDADASEDAGSASSASSASSTSSGSSSGSSSSSKKSSGSSASSGSTGSSSSSGSSASSGSSSSSSSSASTSSSSSASSADSGSDDASSDADADTITVSVSIDSSRAASYGYASSLGSGTVTLAEGSTVYDALCALGVSVKGSSTYVSAIEGLAEFDCGGGSGWMYSVDGVYPNKACGKYVLSGGESIVWVYTCDLGNDL